VVALSVDRTCWRLRDLDPQAVDEDVIGDPLVPGTGRVGALELGPC
jgi:hypothetical protein